MLAWPLKQLIGPRQQSVVAHGSSSYSLVHRYRNSTLIASTHVNETELWTVPCAFNIAPSGGTKVCQYSMLVCAYAGMSPFFNGHSSQNRRMFGRTVTAIRNQLFWYVKEAAPCVHCIYRLSSMDNHSGIKCIRYLLEILSSIPFSTRSRHHKCDFQLSPLSPHSRQWWLLHQPPTTC